MRTKRLWLQNRVLHSVLMLFQAVTTLTAENPAWNGREFKMVVKENTIAPGATSPILFQDVVAAPQGLFIYSIIASRRGQEVTIYLLQGTNYFTLFSSGMPEYSTVTTARHVGMLEDGSLLFQPTKPTGLMPVFRWNGQLAEYLSASATGTNMLAAGGNLLFTQRDAGSNTSIWMGPPGQTQPLLSSTSTSGLGGHIAFDGSTFVFYTGQSSSNNLALWLRSTDGSTQRILTNNQITPFGSKNLELASMTAVNNNGVFVDQGYAYLTLIGGSRERLPDRVLVRTRGNQVLEPLLVLNNTNYGIGGTVVNSFTVGSVRNGIITAVITPRSNPTGLYAWKEGVWSLITTNKAAFDGSPAESFTLYREAQRNQALTLRVNIGSGPNPSYRLYSTDTPDGTSAIAPALSLNPTRPGIATLVLVGQPNTRYQILASPTFDTWAPDRVVQTSSQGQVAQEISTSTPALFYRATTEIVPP